jgi:hypothetical protein
MASIEERYGSNITPLTIESLCRSSRPFRQNRAAFLFFYILFSRGGGLGDHGTASRGSFSFRDIRRVRDPFAPLCESSLRTYCRSYRVRDLLCADPDRDTRCADN